MKILLGYLPGIALCFVLILIGDLFAELLGKGILYVQELPLEGKSPISGIFMAIVLGLLIRNFIGLSVIFQSGVAFSIKFLLKLGIILLGFRLSFFDVLTLGAWGLPIILVCVTTGLIITMWITERLKQPHRLGTLTAVGTGICGVTAIVGTSPSIRANDEEVAYAIANITIFGLFAMFFYPYLAHFIFQHDPIRAGLFLGTAIHETAQVAGSALIYEQIYNSPEVVDVATITKLTRNVCLVAVVPIMSYYYLKRRRKDFDKNGPGKITNNETAASIESTSQEKRWYQLIPLFILGFLFCAILRTVGDGGIAQQNLAFGLWDATQWKSIWTNLNTFGTSYLLGIAMAAVGLQTNLKLFKGFGFKPFIVGLTAAVTVSIVSIVMIFLLGGFISF